MSLKLLSFGIALGAIFYALQNPTVIPLSTSEASFKLKEFWYRTYFMQQNAPYLPREQSHIVQHPPPKDALSPAHLAKQEGGGNAGVGAGAGAGGAATGALADVEIKPVQRAPVYFISHGGPPSTFEQDSMPWRAWQSLGKEIAEYNPSAIVVASPYWLGEANAVYVNNGPENPLMYDFKDFPEDFYSATFESKADILLAEKVIDAFKSYGVKASGKQRGLDHGVWIPFRTMFNGSTSIPIVQVSLFDTGSPSVALKLGQALRGLRDERIMLIGIGMTVYNLQQMAKHDSTKQPPPWAKEFEGQVKSAVTDYTGTNREIKAKQLCFAIPYRNSQPNPDHIWGLHFAIGASGDDEGEVLFSMQDGSLAWGNYRFGQTDQVM